MKHELILDGLNCANCAAKIEKELSDNPLYEDVRFSFATKELSLICEKEDIISDVQALVDSVEDGVTVKLADSDDEESEEHNKIKIILLIVSAVLFIAAFVMHFFESTHLISSIISVLAVALSGYDVVIEGVKSAFKLRLDETTLMTVAVIAAMALGDFVEAAAVTVLFGFGELLEDMAVEKSRRDIRKLSDIRPDTALVYENGLAKEHLAKDIAVGTLLMIPPHTRIPLDGVITEGKSTVDASSLTGESMPISITVGDEVMSGMLNNDTTVYMKTTKVYADSTASRIVKLVEESAKNKGNSEKLITRFARVYTPAVILLGILIAVIPSLITGEWATWLHRALVCLVASCPCSIVISIPLAYFAGIGSASGHGVLIKGGRFLETLAKTKCIAFDKTGTLTVNHISVKEIKALEQYSQDEIIQFAASVESHSNHPIAHAIKDFAQSHNISFLELSEQSELSSCGVSGTWNSHNIFCGKEDGYDAAVVKLDDQVIGLINVTQDIRSEAKSVLRDLKRLGIAHLAMLSGDRKPACLEVAKALQLDEIYTDLLPQDKVSQVEALIQENGSCCFVGDGINDAPVLSRSSCGIAMGLGSDAAIESADMVLSSESLSALPDAIRISRSTMRTVKGNLLFSLMVKAVVITTAALGIAPLWLAVIADTGVCLLCILASVRLIKKKYR